MDKDKNIIEKSVGLFLEFGIKSLTMNDISSKLGISKKTLYSVVTDKNDLVKKCIQHQITSNECELHEACTISHNAVEELINFSRIAGSKMSQIQPSIFFDLQKYHPEAWEMLDAFQNQTIYDLTVQNLEKGIAEGLYRSEINVEIIARLYVSVVQAIFERTAALPEGVSITAYYFEIFNYHIRGIANEKGIELINKYLSS